MSSLDSQLDNLYRLPLGEFVNGRAALAKSLTGAEAQLVRKLAKPTVVPWAVNHVYWRARPVYERVMKAGDKLRRAQVAALEGKKKSDEADLRSAAEAHRRAVAEAVQHAEGFAAADGSHPSPDRLMRTFEALSLSSQSKEPPGRLTRPLQPAGFEALAGITVKAQPGAGAQPGSPAAQPSQVGKNVGKKEEAARKKREADLAKKLQKAEAAVERARRQMLDAQEALRRTRDQIS